MMMILYANSHVSSPYIQTMTILKGIPRLINPRLLHVLASMGHGDELVRA